MTTQHSEVEGLVEVNYETRDYDGIKWIRYDHYEHALTTHGAKEREAAYKQGYVDGFLETGEGYNGEFMPGAKDRHNVTAEDVLATLPQTDVTKN